MILPGSQRTHQPDKMAATTTTTTPSTVLTMKLLVDSNPLRPHVVFAEAGKDTVDFLFSLLAMPAGSAARLLGKESMVGCMGNLYSSAEKLAEGPYVLPGAAKDAVLCAHMPSPAATGPNSWLFCLPEPPAPQPPPPKRFFNCPNSNYWGGPCRTYVTEVSGTRCPNCGSMMTMEARITGPSPPQPVAAKKEGFVQGGMATFMVTDDLTISPMSNVSTIALLNACAIRNFGRLQEKVVQIGNKEGLEILKASLQSKTVLTDVFIGKNSEPPTTNNGRGNRRGNPSLSHGRKPESLSWRD